MGARFKKKRGRQTGLFSTSGSCSSEATDSLVGNEQVKNDFHSGTEVEKPWAYFFIYILIFYMYVAVVKTFSIDATQKIADLQRR